MPNDSRPHVYFQIFDQSLTALFDTGAHRSICGRFGEQRLLDLGIKPSRISPGMPRGIQTAD